MRLEIVHSGAVEKQTLVVYDEGFNYNESAAFGIGKQNRHWFREIDAIVRSLANAAAPTLSIQVGKIIYSIRYNPKDGQHRAAIDYLVRQAKEAQ
jgi:hypothetical protein